MRSRLAEIIASSVSAAQAAGELSSAPPPSVVIEIPRHDEHGDYATGVAMSMAKAEKKAPRAIAETIVQHIAAADFVDSIVIAGPGFINFRLTEDTWRDALREVLLEGERFGACDIGQNERVLVEFVSANPTGPIHVGHGRNAAVGDSLVRIMRAAGYDVGAEHYINDAGSQVDTLARSLHCRYLELAGRDAPLPEDSYPGEYVVDMARALKDSHNDAFLEIPAGEFHPDERTFAVHRMVESMRDDLIAFRVEFETWFSEQALFDEHPGHESAFNRSLEALKSVNALEQRAGATWFIASEWDDDKDRVLIRDTGEPTYFASDIAYHVDKLDRQWERLINVWGADHHGYIPRLRASLAALKHDPEALEIILIQMVNLLRGGQKVQMGKRLGTYVTLREVIDEVGVDAARFTYLTRSHESPLDFDLEAVVEQSADNPVYYVQYAHARIASLFREAEGRGYETAAMDRADLAPLMLATEIALIKTVVEFPEIVGRAARDREPHVVARYLTDLAGEFHRYYNATRVLGEDRKLARARLALAAGVAQVIRNGLTLIGVSAPESM